MNKILIDLAALFVGVVIAFIIQDALPPMEDFHYAHVLLVPMVFCLAAMTLPFAAVLLAALYTGFLSDLVYLHIVGGKVEIPLGSSIVFFVIFGSIASGFQPALKERNVWPLMALSGIGTSGYLLFQFLAITAQRGGFIWESAVTWRILAPGLMAALVAPLFYWTLSQMDRLIPDGSRKMRTITR